HLSPSRRRREVYISPFAQYLDGQPSSLICPSHTHFQTKPTNPSNQHVSLQLPDLLLLR
ncbi:hypothetical protein JI435_200190, partial [Parastagonospora nodorum SN15]